MRNLGIIIITSFLLSGCVTTKIMKASYSSQVDPDYLFSTNKAIAVLVAENENTLETKYYVNQVVEGLKERGFQNVYSYKNVNEATVPIDITVIINVSKKIDSYQYQGANLGLVDSGRTTTNCTGWGYSVNCTQNNQKTIGITGYSTKTGYLTGYYFAANWFSLPSEKKIMFTFAASFEDKCSDRAVYEFLIDETIKRVDFQKPNKYDYSVQMPENYSCVY